MKTKDITIQKVLQITSDKLGVDENKLNYNTSFSDDLGADSLDVYELIVSIEKEFKINIGDEHAEKITTVGKLIDFMNSKLISKTGLPMEELSNVMVTPNFKEQIISKNLLLSPGNN